MKNNQTSILVSKQKLTLTDVEKLWEKFKISEITEIDLSGNHIQNIDVFYSNEHLGLFDDFVNL